MSPRYGRYEVVSKLGEGAMAAVYLARDPVLTRYVAVKVLHANVAAGKTVLQRFFNEAKTVANVRNPHVVEVFDFGKEGRDYYLVMEFVDGQSMQGVLKQLRPPRPGTPPPFPDLPPRSAAPGEPLDDLLTAALLCQAADGLDVAARHGVVHRDIKPENLMINSQGYLKVADFGIAHLQDDSLTRTGAVLGSPLYMSPEQVRGAKPITSQSDMFSLGAVLYRCLTGSAPFAAATLKDLYRKIAAEPHPPLWHSRPDLDGSLAHLADTLLQKEPARRGGGPRWLRAELRAWLLARGVDDPMEAVSLHLRHLAGRGVQTTWNLAPEALLPRTVVASAASRVSEPTLAGYQPSGTLRRTEAAPVPAPGWSVPAAAAPRSRVWISVWVGACLLALGAGAGYLAAHRSLPRHGALPPAAGPAAPAEAAAFAQPSLPVPGAAPQVRVRPIAASPEPELQDFASIAEHEPPVHGEAAPETGTLRVQSSPPFAQVFLDGQHMGVTPLRLAGLAPGPHRILLKRESDHPVDTVILVQPGLRDVRIRMPSRNLALGAED